MSTILTLKAFQELTELPDDLLIELLKANVLPISLDNEQGLLIDCSKVDVQEMLKEFYDARLRLVATARPLLQEHLKAVLARYVSEILTEAESQLNR